MTTPFQNIKHVFVLMLENRAFDHMLGFSGITGKDAVSGTNTKINGLTGNEANSGLKVSQPADWLMPVDPCHEFPCVVEQLGGPGKTYPHGGPYPPVNNSGFVANYTNNGGAASPGEIMKCYSPNQLPVLSALAQEFAVCDNWFSSMPGPTRPNRFFVHAASSAGLDHSPTNPEIAKWFILGLGFQKGTIFDRLNHTSKQWHIFRGDEFPTSLALKGVRFLTKTTPLRQFKDRVQSTKHRYPYDYTFIEPSYGNIFGNYKGGTSQHPLDNVVCGEWLIKNVYEWIRNSPVWNSSLLVVTWDEHGGFYDHLPPTSAPSPGDNSLTSPLNQNGFTFTQYGVRVPAVVVSPLIPQNLIDHRVYDHSSVPKTLESLLGLNPLTQRDTLANSVGELVTLTSPRLTPIALPAPATSGGQCPFPAPPGAGDALVADNAAPFDKVTRPADSPNEGNLPGFLMVARKVDSELSAAGQTLRPAERKMAQPELDAAVDARYKLSHATRESAALYMDQVRMKARAAEHVME